MAENISPIIKKVLDGQINAFEEIVSLYKERVLRIVVKMVPKQNVDEVSQEVFIKVFSDLSSYRSEAPFEHWLTKIACRTCYDFWRKERRKERRQVNSEHLELLSDGMSLEAFNHEQFKKRGEDLVQTVLGKISPEERLLFELFYIEELSLKEISKKMGWTVIAIKMRLFRCRKHLKTVLRNLSEE